MNAEFGALPVQARELEENYKQVESFQQARARSARGNQAPTMELLAGKHGASNRPSDSRQPNREAKPVDAMCIRVDSDQPAIARP